MSMSDFFFNFTCGKFQSGLEENAFHLLLKRKKLSPLPSYKILSCFAKIFSCNFRQ